MECVGWGPGKCKRASWVRFSHPDPKQTSDRFSLLHGTYGLGATVAPLVSTLMITKGHLQWYTFFYILLALAALELLLSLLAFRTATAAVFRASHPASKTHNQSPTREAFTHRVTWLIALLLFFCVGVEVSVGGWVVTFMQTVRGGEPFASGAVATGFWLGLTVGRMVLGFVTGRIGEKLAVAGYVVLAIVSELLSWLVPSFVSSAICVAWLGFFIGPLFPGAVVVVTKLLPVRLHVSAIGFVAAIGSSGSAVMPFITGAIA
jgi:fucose permease